MLALQFLIKKNSISGALNLNEKNFDIQIVNVLQRWSPNMTVIVYCNKHHCGSSQIIAQRLQSKFQMNNVFVFKGDWKTLKQKFKGL